ncbi:MAG TPA: hypothetical protein VGO58_09935, partial [Chitinophagaceae bacterium]|nr:hypothetical protein [Chitinophagaceae bacterium]
MHTVFSHDNKFIVTADEKMTIISDVRSGKPLFYLTGTNPSVSMDNRSVVTIKDSSVLVWSMASGELVAKRKIRSKAIDAFFHPSRTVLLIQGHADGDIQDPLTRSYYISIWDFSTDQLVGEFNPANKEKGKSPVICNGNNEGHSGIYGAWFTDKADSIRLVYQGGIATFAYGNFTDHRNACFSMPGNNSLSGSVRILNNRIIGLMSGAEAYWFNEYGQLGGSWTLNSEPDFESGVEAESISPTYNYHLSYTHSSITIRDLRAKTSRFYEAASGGIKKLTLNEAGTHALLEYLDEAPRIFSLATFSEAIGLSEKDYRGFPVYVYETRTLPDASMATAFFDSIDTKIPSIPKQVKVVTNFLGVEDPTKNVRKAISGMRGMVNS